MLNSLDRHLRDGSPLDWVRLLTPPAVAGVVLTAVVSSTRDGDMLLAWGIAGASVLLAAVVAARRPVLAVVLVLAVVAAQAGRVIPAVARDDYGYAYVVAVLLVLILAVAGSRAGRWRIAVVFALSLIVFGTTAWTWAVGWPGRGSALGTRVLGVPGTGPSRPAPVLSSLRDEVFTSTVQLALVAAVVGGAGLLLRFSVTARATRAELVRARKAVDERDARTALLDQRRRIAADVHDVLAHSLTVIVAQGEGALVSEEPVRSAAVTRLVGVARSSLRDVRGLIERLDDEASDVPSPGAAQLPGLVDTFAATGLRVTLEEHGHAGQLTESTQLAAYRIVQEALTNVLKHGGHGSIALVTLDWRGSAPDLLLTVASISGGTATRQPTATLQPTATGRNPGGSDDGGNDGGLARLGTGRRVSVGVSSMQTRAAMCGGWLSAGPTEGGWIVTAQLPVQEHAVGTRR